MEHYSYKSICLLDIQIVLTMTHMSTLYHTCIQYIVIHGTIGKGVGRVSPLPLTFLLFFLSREFLEPLVDFLYLLLEESLLVFEELSLLFLAGGLSPWGGIG